MVFINKTAYFTQDEAIYHYWSYIVVTTVFNGFLINMVRLRESGFFKTLTYLVGSKYSIIVSNLLVQVLVVQMEILIFNLIVMIFIAPVSIITFLYGFLTTFLTTLLTAAMLSGFLLLKIKQFWFNNLCGLFFFWGLLFMGLHLPGLAEYILVAMNPFQFIYGIYIVPCTSLYFEILITCCILFYLVLGSIVFKNISIKRQLR